MFRLAHISDVHLSPLPKPTFKQLCSKRITGYLNWRMKRSCAMQKDNLGELIADMRQQNADHIALTGDLVNLALPQEFENAKAWLHKLGSPEDTSVILGNHDAYVPRSFKRAVENFGNYMRSDETAIKDLGLLEEGFPYLKIRGGIAIIGVNSAEATLPFFATGYFKKAQAARLKSILEYCKTLGLFRLVMIHHPPVVGATHHHKRLIGIKRFQKIIAEAGAELILHGHTHLATLSYIDGEIEAAVHKQVPVLCVPSASQGLGGHKPAARYNLLDISKADGSWQISWTARGFCEKSQAIETLENKML